MGLILQLTGTLRNEGHLGTGTSSLSYLYWHRNTRDWLTDPHRPFKGVFFFPRSSLTTALTLAQWGGVKNRVQQGTKSNAPSLGAQTPPRFAHAGLI